MKLPENPFTANRTVGAHSWAPLREWNENGISGKFDNTEFFNFHIF